AKCRASRILRRESSGVEISRGVLLMRMRPSPLRTVARATAVLRLPLTLTILALMSHTSELRTEGLRQVAEADRAGGVLKGLRLHAGLLAGKLVGDADPALQALVGRAVAGRLLVVEHAAHGALHHEVGHARVEGTLAGRAHVALEVVALEDGFLRAAHGGLLRVHDVDLFAREQTLRDEGGEAASARAGRVDHGDDRGLALAGPRGDLGVLGDLLGHLASPEDLHVLARGVRLHEALDRHAFAAGGHDLLDRALAEAIGRDFDALRERARGQELAGHEDNVAFFRVA